MDIKYEMKNLSTKPEKIWWIGLGVMMLACLLNYCYNDLQIIVRHSMNIWNLLAQGRLLEFYRTGSSLMIGNMNQINGEVPYDFWVYIPFAVWNLPVFLWEKMTGQTFETNYLALLWMRLEMMIPFIGCNWALWKIAGQMKKNEVVKAWACYLFSSSMFLLAGLFCIGQIDIMNAFFMLMGIAAYMRKDKKKFIMWFVLAITCKMIALFVFIPLLLLMEKRILYIIRYALEGISLSLLSKLIFFKDKMETPTQFDERRFIRLLLERRLEMNEVSISVFAVLFLVLLIWCWCAQCDDNKWEQIVIWVSFAGYSCFFAGSVTLPYWAVVYAPFLPLLVLAWPRKTKYLVWLELLAGVTYFIESIFDRGFVYSAEMNIRWMLSGIINNRAIKGIDFYSLFVNLSDGAQDNLRALMVGGFIAAIAAMLVLTYPQRQSEESDGLIVDRGSIAFRALVNCLFALIPLLGYWMF